MAERDQGPGAVWDLVHGFVEYWAAVAAVRTGLFDALSSEPVAIDELAERLGRDRTRVATLVGALVAAGLVERDGDHVRPTELVSSHLTSGASGYMGDLLTWSTGPWSNWLSLADTVVGEDPPCPPGPDFHRRLVEASFASQLEVARTVIDRVVEDLPAVHVLDIGCGLAPWTIAILERDQAATAHVNDLDEVLAGAEHELRSRDLLDRVELVPGDYRSVSFPEADVVVLGHVCRARGEQACGELIRRAAAATRPGGRLVVSEYLIDDDGAGPPGAQLMGLVMLANNGSGHAFTEGRMRRLLADNAFTEVERVTRRGTDVLTATRRT